MKKLEFIKSKKLLNIDNNAKTVKGQKYGYMTAVLYLAPSNESGFNVCPMASQGCKKACLYTAGHGAFSNVQQGRINKTRWYIQERDTFLDQLRKEINEFILKAKNKNLIPCIRLNGTSDISWEKTGLIEEYKSIQWYDATDAWTFNQHIFPETDDSRDLGSASKRFRNIYTTDLHLSNDRGDWTIIEEEDYLTLRNNKTDKIYKLVMEEIE